MGGRRAFSIVLLKYEHIAVSFAIILRASYFIANLKQNIHSEFNVLRHLCLHLSNLRAILLCLSAQYFVDMMGRTIQLQCQHEI